MLTNNSPNSPKKFTCSLCDYGCSKKSDFDKHLSSNKHKSNEESNKCNTKVAESVCNNCNKIYKSRVGLWRHKKTCLVENNSNSENITLDDYPSTDNFNIPDAMTDNDLKTIILQVVKSNSELQKQNHELQKQVLDVCQKIQPVTNNNNNINNNSHNKTFNLNFFLNEQCKDAMNLMDFVNTIQLKISDMERIGELGYVEGISNIIMENLNGMDIYKRPIHCSDAKRETMHIKDNNVWEKDTVNNDKMRKAIKHITWLNTKLLFAWAAEHPGVVYSDHKLNDKYCEMIVEAMGGKRNKTIEEGESKIIKKISKMVIIDKTIF